mgnify:CR=1 FL=1
MSIEKRIEQLEQAVGRDAPYCGLGKATFEAVLDLFCGNRTFVESRRGAVLARQGGDIDSAERRDAESNEYAYNLVAERFGAGVAERFFADAEN